MASTKWADHWKIWTGVFLAITVLTMAYGLLSNRRAIPTVQIVRAARTGLSEFITCNGKIEPVDARVFRAQFESFVTGVFAKEGRQVRRGETILTLDAKEIRADLAQAKVQQLAAQDSLRDARAGGPPDEKAQLEGDLRQAQVDVKRLQQRQEALAKPLEAHASTKEEVRQNAAALSRARSLLDELQKKQNDFADRASLEVKSDLLSAQQAEEEVHLQENKLRSATVTADVDGTLYSFPLRKGDFVRVGDVLAEIADLRKVRLRAFVDESDLGLLKQGGSVDILKKG